MHHIFLDDFWPQNSYIEGALNVVIVGIDSSP